MPSDPSAGTPAAGSDPLYVTGLERTIEPMSLAIVLLGAPRVEQDGVQRSAPRGYKPWALLAYSFGVLTLLQHFFPWLGS